MRLGGPPSLSLSLLLAAAGCLPQQAAETFLLRSHFDLVPNLSYGAAERQRLDVYRPRGVREAPVVVFLYGGRWQHGSKRQYRLLGDAITRQGFLAVIPDYRLSPEVEFPAWVEDAAGAVRWVRDSIQRFGGDAERIVVVGHSSGAHTAALLALDERHLTGAGVAPAVVRGYVSLAGPVATTWTDPDVQALMGPPGTWRATYPLEQVDGSEPPLLLLHGGRDQVVEPANSLRLAARIRSRGGCAGLEIYEGLNHVAIVLALSVPRLALAPVLDEVLRFARRPSAVCTPGQVNQKPADHRRASIGKFSWSDFPLPSK